MSKQITNTDKEAVEYFKNYLQQEGFFEIEKLPTFSDVAADVKAVSPKGRVTYFEIKIALLRLESVLSPIPR